MSAPTVASSSSSTSNEDPDRPLKRQRFSVFPPPSSQDVIPAGVAEGDGVKSALNYRGGMFLAPMVRIGCLTTRLLALEYGADLVWGPEIVDRAIIGAERRVNPVSGVVEYQRAGPKPIWSTHPIEKSRLIYQIGSADPELALQAAKTVMQDVSGIDLNCGCPKSFSTSGGMGAALLSEPEKLCSILRHLVTNLPTMLISCKIRLLPTSPATLSLVSQICSTGISCLTVHCRTRDMRSSEPALLHRLREVVDLVDRETEGRVPVVANGDCFSFEDAQRIRELTGVTSVMVARGAEANVSCFSREGKRDPESEVIPLFVKVAVAVDQSFGLAKYCLNTMDVKSGRPTSNTVGDKLTRKSLKKRIAVTKSYEDMCALVGIEDVEGARRTRVEELLPGLARGNLRLLEEGKVAAGAVEVGRERAMETVREMEQVRAEVLAA